MEWNDNKGKNTKKGMSLSTKLLLVIIVCIFLIIILIYLLLMNGKKNSFTLSLNGKEVTSTTMTKLSTKIDGITYINIKEFANLVKYKYHDGEYKAMTTEKDKCYVEGTNETASFYLNDNKIYKLLLNEMDKEYDVYEVENKIQSVNGLMYAPIEAINIAFNSVIEEASNYFKIYTLDNLVKTYDTKVKKWGYESILNEEFENKKLILKGYIIVKEKDSLYKVIDLKNTKEIIPPKYSLIKYNEYMNEFIVTTNSKQIGVIDLEGINKLQPVYESVELFDKENDLYLIQKSKKHGIVKKGDITIIFPEYDQIGVNSFDLLNESVNKNFILDTLIPVCKNEKWGAYNKEGNLILELEYDGFGYDLAEIELNGKKETVQPILAIKKCDGLVIKKDNKYGLVNLKGETLVTIVVDAIYAKNIEDENSKYFMLYNGKESNLIKELIDAGYIKENSDDENEEIENEVTNNIENEIKENNVVNESLNNNIEKNQL